MLKDLNNKRVLTGRTERTITESFFFGSSLPPWLTVTGAGTYNIIPPHQDYGYLLVETGANTNDEVKLNILPGGIDMSKVKEVTLTLKSLVPVGDFSDFSFYFDLMDTGRQNGISIYNMFKTVRAYKDGVYVLQSPFYSLSENKRVNISITLRSDGILSISEEDGVVFELKYPTTQLNTSAVLFPCISLKNTSGSVRSFKLSEVSLSIVHN